MPSHFKEVGSQPSLPERRAGRAPEKSKIFWERGAIARKSAALLSRQGARKGHIATTAKPLSKCEGLWIFANHYGVGGGFPDAPLVTLTVNTILCGFGIFFKSKSLLIFLLTSVRRSPALLRSPPPPRAQIVLPPGETS